VTKSSRVNSSVYVCEKAWVDGVGSGDHCVTVPTTGATAPYGDGGCSVLLDCRERSMVGRIRCGCVLYCDGITGGVGSIFCW
jgi:hypothetical protein